MTTPPAGPAERSSFWDQVGASFPSLKGAASTAYYLECERRLFELYAPELRNLVTLKTDLWDEAKNTEILRWVAEQGARPTGVDIAFDIVREARCVLGKPVPGFAVGDVRYLPFKDRSVDLVYSMGTIEHFPEYALATREICRVLKPGGTAIIGVPNKCDPFLRPLLVHVLNLFGWYGYGMEKSFTPGELRGLVEAAGLRVTATTGILFIPGWLRMLDLWCHTRGSPAVALTRLLVRPFAWLYRHVPAVHRHGYLAVAVAERPRSLQRALAR
jgi:SAM-dependent methyltransferase